MISRRTVVYGNGTIARDGDPVTFHVDSEELDLCMRLASEVAALMKGVDVGLGSESTDEFSAFWICSDVGDTATKIDEELIRSCFGGTLFPPVTIDVEPVSEQSKMFNEVQGDYEDVEEDDPEGIERGKQIIQKWRTMFEWFNNQPEFKDRATVHIGEYRQLSKLSKDNSPPNCNSSRCVAPLGARADPKGQSLWSLWLQCSNLNEETM